MMMKKLIWAVASAVVIVEAGGIPRLAAWLRAAIVVVDVVLFLVALSGGGYVIVIYRNSRPRKQPVIPAPDPQLTQRTRTTVTDVTVRPPALPATRIPLPGERATLR